MFTEKTIVRLISRLNKIKEEACTEAEYALAAGLRDAIECLEASLKERADSIEDGMKMLGLELLNEAVSDIPLTLHDGVWIVEDGTRIRGVIIDVTPMGFRIKTELDEFPIVLAERVSRRFDGVKV